MPPAAWYAAFGVLAFCLLWRLGFYVLWRGTFGGRPIARRDNHAHADRVVTLRSDGSRADAADINARAR